MEELELGIGDRIEVYKANMIIPQIASNLTRSGVKDIPERCPACGGKTEIRRVVDTKALYCTNDDCSAKRLKSFALFVSTEAPCLAAEVRGLPSAAWPGCQALLFSVPLAPAWTAPPSPEQSLQFTALLSWDLPLGEENWQIGLPSAAPGPIRRPVQKHCPERGSGRMNEWMSE